MCIRYERDNEKLVKWSRVRKRWTNLGDFAGDKSMFPGSDAPIIIPNSEVTLARWGVIPVWAKDAKFGKTTGYNSRSETITEKAMWRTSFKQRRCVVPASAFYERTQGRWIKFSAKEDEILLIAGLYEDPNRLTDMPTYALITTEPNAAVEAVHDRMPVVLSESDVDRWLADDAEKDELLSLLLPCPPDWFVLDDAEPVSSKNPAAPVDVSTLVNRS